MGFGKRSASVVIRYRGVVVKNINKAGASYTTKRGVNTAAAGIEAENPKREALRVAGFAAESPVGPPRDQPPE
jgi:hypothetical protein